jgi:hypothetical protein
MKAILEFNLPEDREDFELANKAASMSCALNDISNLVFRPARKHGYGNNEKVAKLIEEHPQYAEELIGELEQMFFEILRDNEVEL